MKWRREVNYHGSRGYGSEDAPVRLSSLTIAWLVEMAKIKLGKLRSLAINSRAAPAECPVPVKPQVREHDWRVFP